MKTVSVVIPTKNAGELFKKTLDGIKKQSYAGKVELVVVDSGSTDSTIALARDYGAAVFSIPPDEFDHGLTRNKGIENSSGEIIVLLSQDAIPGDASLIHNFVAAFDDERVAGAYGRQLPREEADLITKRNLKNWFTGRDQKEVRWIDDWSKYNAQSPMERYFFCNFDNVCSAVRRSVWQDVQFHASDFGEDIDWAQRVLELGWKIAYIPAAHVIHSHARSIQYEFLRNRLCHRTLYRQFGIAAVPSLKLVAIAALVTTWSDWKYVLRQKIHPWELIKTVISIPLLNLASVYGQYKGLRSGQSTEKP